jgi:mRNA interferase MazF
VLANTDFSLAGWQAAGLNVPSGIKAQLATVHESLVVKIVGRLTQNDINTLDERMRGWLKL